MSTSIDTVNRLVSVDGNVNDEGGWYYPLFAPLNGVIGLQFAVRAYVDSFNGGAVAPWTLNSVNGRDAYTYDTAGSWDHSMCMGFGFTPQFPAIDYAKNQGFGDIKGFFGVRTGGDSDGTQKFQLTHYGAAAIGNVAGSVGPKTDTNSYNRRTYTALWINPTKQSSSNYAVIGTTGSILDLLNVTDPTSAEYWLKNFPVNPTQGAKYTFGFDIRRSDANESTLMRVSVNTNSLSEANMLTVFSQYDDISPQYRISRSNAAVDADDAFREGGATFIPPGYFLFRCGFPSQKFVVKGIRYRYIYP